MFIFQLLAIASIPDRKRLLDIISHFGFFFKHNSTIAAIMATFLWKVIPLLVFFFAFFAEPSIMAMQQVVQAAPMQQVVQAAPMQQLVQAVPKAARNERQPGFSNEASIKIWLAGYMTSPHDVNYATSRRVAEANIEVLQMDKTEQFMRQGKQLSLTWNFRVRSIVNAVGRMAKDRREGGCGGREGRSIHFQPVAFGIPCRCMCWYIDQCRGHWLASTIEKTIKYVNTSGKQVDA